MFVVSRLPGNYKDTDNEAKHRSVHQGWEAWPRAVWNAKVYFFKFFGGHMSFLCILEATRSREWKIYFLFFFKYLEDVSPFCGAPDTPALNFWLHLS